MGSWHAAHVRNSGIADVAGVYDPDPARRNLALEEGFPVFDRLDTLLDCDADMAVVAAPNDTHKPLTCTLLESGRHVLVEKPAALSEAQLISMYEQAEKNDRLLGVHQNRRFDRDFTTVREVLSLNLLGTPFRLESRIHGSRGIPEGWRRNRTNGGGMLLDWGPHLVDQALLAFPESFPVRLSCRFTYITESAVEDGFSLELDYGGGKTVLIEVGTCNFIPMPRFYLCGRNGTAMINDWREDCRVTQCFAFREEDVRPAARGNGITKTMAPRDELTTKTFSIEPKPVKQYALLQNFCAAAEGKESLSVTREQMIAVMRVLDAAFCSAFEERPVYFEGLGKTDSAL